MKKSLIIFSFICTLVLVSFFFMPLTQRYMADWSIKPMCEADGGIRVFEKVQLEKGKFATPAQTNWSDYQHGRLILKDYQIKKTHTFLKLHGAAVYKYITWIERNSDQKRLSEMIQYFRQGDEMFHGKHCPENITEKTLIDKTFISVGALNPDDLPLCASESLSTYLVFESVRLLPPLKLSNIFPDIGNPTWNRQYHCDSLTESRKTYSRISSSEIRLSGTQLLFDAETGNRCRSIAMSDPDRMVCTDDSIWLIGRKGISYREDLIIQKYSRNGALISETLLKNSTVGKPSRIVGFQENQHEIKVELITYEQKKGDVLCHQISAPKTSITSESASSIDASISKILTELLPGCSGL